MAVKSGVVDTSVVKGIADLHAEVLSNDPVVAPAHEVVQDSDLIADPSIHADTAADHGADTAIHATDDASAADAGHVHADLAYADSDHGYADVDHAYADVDHAYADHAYADANATVPDSVFADHSIPSAYDGTPHSLGADAGKGDDGHDAAVWWWAGGAALAGGGIGYWLGTEHNDDSSTTATGSDVHVVVERDGAWIDTNGDGVHQVGEVTAANFQSGDADLSANHVTVHFNDVPLDALNLTGFGEDDKIEFHVQSLMDNGVLDPVSASSITNLYISASTAHYGHVSYEFYYGTSVEVHQHSSVSDTGYARTDFAGHGYNPLGGYLSMDSIYSSITTTVSEGLSSNDYGMIAFWSDTGNALNHNTVLIPNYTGDNTSAVLDNVNANNEGHLVDFIWPSGAPIG